jgi:hypothetical protein
VKIYNNYQIFERKIIVLNEIFFSISEPKNGQKVYKYFINFDLKLEVLRFHFKAESLKFE